MVAERKGMKNLHSNIIKQSALQIHMALKTVWFMTADTKGIWRSSLSCTLQPQLETDLVAFVSFNGPTLQVGIYHALLYTFHLNICKMPVCLWIQVCIQRPKGWGVSGLGERGWESKGTGWREEKKAKNYAFILSFLSLSSSLFLFLSFQSFLKRQEAVLRHSLKILNLHNLYKSM